MKRNIHQRMIIALLPVLFLVACDNYLDLTPKGVKTLTSTTDYDQWLNNTSLANSIPNALNTLADNVDAPTIPTPATSVDDFIYTWQPQFSVDVTATPQFWAKFYADIYYYNTVLQGIDQALGTSEEKKSLKAEARLGRAFYYVYLVNLYGKPYNVNTAGEDLAVPFVTSNDVEDAVPARSTVKDIYEHIISDIESAIPGLPKNNNNNRFRGSVAAGYSILARVYLYMGNFPKAAQNAQLALDNGPNVIFDYSTLANPNTIAFNAYRPDAIYARQAISPASQTIPTLAFLRSFDIKDQRLKFFYTNLGNYTFPTRGTTRFQPSPLSYTAHANWGTSVAEMRLIVAEAAARSGDLPIALNELHQVRKCRFVPADYVRYESSVQADVLNKILAERAFEFSYNGLRWFDMRRLDAEGRMLDVNRYNGQGTIIATLPRHSNKYTLQIPMQVMYYNSGWPQNPQ